MASKVGIANIALRLVNGGRITSFSQGNKEANLVSDLYDERRRELLSFPWNFAGIRVKLARSLTTPTFGFTYAYVLPSDWLYTVSVHDNDAGIGTILYKEEQVGGQNVLLADEEDVYLHYTKDEEDPNLMTASFRRALASSLAADLAIPIANSRGLQQELRGQAKSDLNKAKSQDSQGSFPSSRPRGSWANVRNGLRSRGGFNDTSN